MSIPNKDSRERKTKCFPKEHAALTATTTIKLFKATKRCRVDRVDYINPTGLAGHGTDAFAGAVKNSSTVVCSLFNTDTGDAGGASLAADTFVTGTNGTAANRTLAKDDVLSAVFTMDGTATLPAGTVLIYFTELN